MDAQAKISGIFSCKTSIKVGFGATKQTALSETFWFVKETPNGNFSVQSLDMDFKRQGQPFEISRNTLFEDYHLEPDLSYRLLSQPLLIGDHYRASTKYNQAEQEYQKIKRIDEDNIRANFGLGLLYLAMDKPDKASYIFNRLVVWKRRSNPSTNICSTNSASACARKGSLTKRSNIISAPGNCARTTIISCSTSPGSKIGRAHV